MSDEKRDYSRTYQWIITTLVGFSCFVLGMFIQSERMNEQIITNSIKIEQHEKVLAQIDMKLDRMLRINNDTSQ